jgi:hypothetical protein
MGFMKSQNVARMLGGSRGGLAMRCETFFDRPAVLRATARAEHRILNRSGAIVRLAARRSIRKRPGPSKAPAAPHTHGPGYFLRGDIFYSYDRSSRSAVCGPSKAPWLNELHERGGAITLNVWRNLASGREQAFRRGPQSPRKYKRVKRITKTYPARPFMGPAEEKTRDRRANLWRDSVY